MGKWNELVDANLPGRIPDGSTHTETLVPALEPFIPQVQPVQEQAESDAPVVRRSARVPKQRHIVLSEDEGCSIPDCTISGTQPMVTCSGPVCNTRVRIVNYWQKIAEYTFSGSPLLCWAERTR